MTRHLTKRAALLVVFSIITLASLFIARDALRREADDQKRLAELLDKRDCGLFPYVDNPVTFSVDFYGYKYHGRSDNYVDAQILHCGAYEKPELYFLRDVMQALGTKGIFVDVGANTGQHSLFMSRYSKEVHAFEPYPPVLQRFRDMISLNGIQNIRVHPIGLGNKNAKLPFYDPPPENLGTGSFDPTFKSNNKKKSKLSLDIVVGDDAFEKLGIPRVDLIKVDVEGYEKPVLEGLTRTLTAQRPIIVMELTVDPDLSSGFKSEQDLRNVLPERYNILMFDEGLGHAGLGYYFLTSFEANFDNVEQYNLVVYPSEKMGLIAHSNIK